MPVEQRNGRWQQTVEVTAPTEADLIKRVAAVDRLLKKLDKQKPKPRRPKGEGALYKRESDGMWVGQIDLPKGPDGKRLKSKPVYSKDRATAVAKLGKLKDQQDKGLPQIEQRLKLKTYLQDWVRDVAPTKVRPHVLRSYRSAINTRITPAIGDRYLANLQPEHIRYLHDWILGHTYKRGGEDIPYATRSVEEAHNVLSSALSDAVADGKAHRNVCELVSKPEVRSKSHGELTSEQARTVLLTAHREKDQLVTRWAAGLMLGGRQGELLGLEWDRIDFERGQLDLSWQLEWLPLKEGARPDDPERFDVRPDFEHRPIWRGAAWTRPKTAKSERIIPLPEPLAAILTVHRQQTPANPWNLAWVTLPTKKSRHKYPKPISDADDLAGWKAAQTRAGVKPVDIHAMRGTTATLLLEAGVDARVIQAILGHVSDVTTRGYQRVDLALASKALGSLDRLLEIA